MSENLHKGRPSYKQNSVTAQRIYQLRQQHRETQSELAQAVLTTKSSVSRWESGRRGVDPKTLLRLAEHFGVLPEYLAGETDIKDDDEAFRREQDEKIAQGFNAAIEKHEYGIRRTRLEKLFSFCGFNYHDHFDRELLHILSDESALVSAVTFTDAEIDTLLSRIHDLIAFECYRKTI